MDSDGIVTQATERLQANYGGSIVGGWEQWLAMVMDLLSTCLGSSPTAQEVRAAYNRPLVRILLMSRAHRLGVYGAKADKLLKATKKTLDDSTDEEVTALVAAAQENA